MNHPQLVARLAKLAEDIIEEMTPEKAHLWHMATGVATEAGEILSTVKAHVCYDKPIDRENVIEELGDIEFYLEGLRARLSITRDEVLEHNIQKLLRRYPGGGFSNHDAQTRKDKS
jgi:NTP pyrophosphatase (non-canonical NTP hydrolase)